MSKFSQNEEEIFIVDYFQRIGLNSGRLLDIGAFEGISFSNVRAMMLKFPEWKGVFVEPSSYCFSKLADLYKMEPRRAELINAAIVTEDQLGGSGLLKFYDAPFSAVSSSVEGHTNRWYNEKNSDGDVVNPRKVFVGKVGMREILKSFGPFDFINIDVEGYSAKLALQEWFNPSDYGCKLLCIEHDGLWQQLQAKMIGHGYTVLHTNRENLIMVKT